MVDFEYPQGICSYTFVIDNFLGLFLKYYFDGVLSDFWY